VIKAKPFKARSKLMPFTCTWYSVFVFFAKVNFKGFLSKTKEEI